MRFPGPVRAAPLFPWAAGAAAAAWCGVMVGACAGAVTALWLAPGAWGASAAAGWTGAGALGGACRPPAAGVVCVAVAAGVGFGTLAAAVAACSPWAVALVGAAALVCPLMCETVGDAEAVETVAASRVPPPE